MPVAADEVASALAATIATMVASLPNGWIRRAPGVIAGYSGVPVPTQNGVIMERPDADVATVEALLSEVRATGIPHCLVLRPGRPDSLVELALANGMVAMDPSPLMALDDPAALAPAQEVEALVLRQLSPNEAELHADVAADGFEAPRELFRRFAGGSLLSQPGARAYVGEVDGRPVTTGLGVVAAGAVGIFNIGTVPAARGRGYGAAVTARAVADGLANGAAWSWLQSAPLAIPVYERLGFMMIEHWERFVTPPEQN